MRRCKARKAALHAGGMSESNGSWYWGKRRKLLPMGLGWADSLCGREAIGRNAQPMGGWGMRRDLRSVQICRADLKSALRRL